jgi:hypothetical protein
MSRPLRIEYPGAVYHVTSRGDAHRPIFRDDQDRLLFLERCDRCSSCEIRLYPQRDWQTPADSLDDRKQDHQGQHEKLTIQDLPLHYPRNDTACTVYQKHITFLSHTD